MGYEIGFAYTNFDNATMYPLILLILLMSIFANGLLLLGEAAACPPGNVMTAGGDRKPLRNTIILIAGLLVFWELAYLAVGDVAMRSPWQTVTFLGRLMATDTFWPHLAESHESLCRRAFYRHRYGARDRFCVGFAWALG